MNKNEIQSKIVMAVLEVIGNELQEPTAISFRCRGKSPLVSVEMDESFVSLNFEFAADLYQERKDLNLSCPEEDATEAEAKQAFEEYIITQILGYTSGTKFEVNEYNWCGELLVVDAYQEFSSSSAEDISKVFGIVNCERKGA
jgi:hypothetical protein